MKLKRVEIAWLSFKESTIPADAPDYQVADMKRSFYAGALSLFNILIDLGDKSTEEATDDDVKMIQEISDEMDEFFASIVTKH